MATGLLPDVQVYAVVVMMASEHTRGIGYATAHSAIGHAGNSEASHGMGGGGGVVVVVVVVVGGSEWDGGSVRSIVCQEIKVREGVFFRNLLCRLGL